jgi:hypothetical protein
MKWFRFYHEFIDDPKVAMMSDSDQLLWVKALCLASESEQRGCILLNDEEIAWRLRCSIESWKHAIDKFRAKGMIEHCPSGYKITSWDKRQFDSDNSAERTKAYRERLEGKRKAERDRKKQQREKQKMSHTLSQECHINVPPNVPGTSDGMSQKNNAQNTEPVKVSACDVTVTPPDTDPDPETDPKKEFKNKLSLSDSLSQTEKLPEREREEFLEFCQRQYEQNNKGKRLTLPVKYANTHFDELYAQFQNSMPLKGKIKANTKKAQEAEIIMQSKPRDEWPEWVYIYA